MENKSMHEAFEQVWARVTHADEECQLPESSADKLKKFIAGEEASIACYRHLAAHSCGSVRRVILQILADERRHLKNLQMEYFMETGDTCPAGADKHIPKGMLTTLRECVMAENSASRAYMDASKAVGGQKGAMYHCMGEDEARHAGMLREILGRCFTEQD